ncbi:TetR/AcrR family transcriptional regulator [Nostoc sp.]|uniref:TetR/AcrR family transcriptional regulator n=1 Tax=Nostoc sp. TaxID=1180 RepID=UPI002FFB724B
MARTPKITNQQILEAARQVFLQHGFGASTLEIAQQAGISEASIFKRFSTKEELFFAAMGIPEKPVWVNELESLCGKGNLKENLTNICFKIMEFYSEMLPQIMMLRSRGNALPEPGDKEPRPIRDIKALTAFLQYEINQNRLRPCDPQTVAHILLGSLMNYVLLEQISSQAIIERVNLPIGTYLNSEVRAIKVSAFIQSFVDIVWQGIAPIQD